LFADAVASKAGYDAPTGVPSDEPQKQGPAAQLLEDAGYVYAFTCRRAVNRTRAIDPAKLYGVKFQQFLEGRGHADTKGPWLHALTAG
jgi:hypothetical protein